MAHELLKLPCSSSNRKLANVEDWKCQVSKCGLEDKLIKSWKKVDQHIFRYLSVNFVRRHLPFHTFSDFKKSDSFCSDYITLVGCAPFTNKHGIVYQQIITVKGIALYSGEPFQNSTWITKCSWHSYSEYSEVRRKYHQLRTVPKLVWNVIAPSYIDFQYAGTDIANTTW